MKNFRMEKRKICYHENIFKKFQKIYKKKYAIKHLLLYMFLFFLIIKLYTERKKVAASKEY